jgi:hypothetical protein
LRRPNTYEGWGACIAANLFREDNAERPVVLYVDDETLGSMADFPSPEAAVASLTRVVARRLHAHADNIFSPILSEALLWSARGKPDIPPFMPAIAVAIIAAAHMASEASMRSTNYYRRFRELLALEGRGEPRGYSETFPLLWRYLAEWLDVVQQRRLGRSTIAPGAYSNIGYALSQTVMKRADRDRLGELFVALDLRPGETEVDGAELLAAYQAWARTAPLSRSAKSAATRPECAPQLQAILETELHAWDGNTIDEEGNRVAGVHLAIEFSPMEIYLIAERPRGFPSPLTGTTLTGARTMLRSSVAGWYDPLGESVGHALADGLSLHADGFVLRFSPPDVIVLRQDQMVGAWVSAREVQPNVVHCTLVKEAILKEVCAYLDRYAEAGWEAMPPSRKLPPGWTLIRSVAIANPPDSPVSDELAPLVPSVRGRVALAGGLPMAPLIPGTQSCYLVGGEPDVWVPRWTVTLDPTEVTVDGELVGSLAGGGRLRLADHDLPPGDHEVAVGSSRRHFLTLVPLAERSEREGELAHRLYRSEEAYALLPQSDPPQRPAGEQIWVTGVLVCGREEDLPQAPHEVVRLRRRAAEYRLLGAAPGQVAYPAAGSEPGWLRLPQVRLQASLFDATASFPVVWALWRWRSDGWWSGRAVTPLEPLFEPGPEVDEKERTAWADSFAVDVHVRDNDIALWSRYRRSVGLPS